MRDERFVLGFSPSAVFTIVDGIRAGDDVPGTVAAVRARVRAEGRTRVIWQTGPLSEPADLAEQLHAQGLVPADGGAFEPDGTALALERAPSVDAPPEIVVRAASNPADVREAFTIQFRCNGVPEDSLADWVEPMVESYDPETLLLCIAELDGAPVAAAGAVPTPDGVWLTGAGTLPEARGRGAYRALIAARWAEAVERGTPALVVQAGTMSRPVLERAGFEPVGELLYLRDEL